MEQSSEMFDVQLGEFLIRVDREIFKSLQDPEFAQEYEKQVHLQCSKQYEQSASNNPEPEVIWRTSKNPTQRDIEATKIFLSLRKELNDEFEDKKTSKNCLWLKIATKLNEMGYFVGTGINGREKCRQKFMNIQHSYMKYKDLSNQTGQGSIKKPPFFDDIDEILGDKHKAQPVFVIDSCKPSTSGVKNGIEGSPVKASDGIPKTSRFNTIKKTVRPKKTVLSAVENILKEERCLRQQQFEELVSALKIQNEQRHQQTMGIIEVLKNLNKNSD